MPGALAIDDLQQVQRGFAANRFLGLHASLELFRSALGAGETGRCADLVTELGDGGYPGWPGKESLLLDLQDMVILRERGIAGLEAHYERRRLAPAEDAEALMRLGILHQSQDRAQAARGLYERSLALSERAGHPRAQRARELLLSLEHQQQTGEVSEFFRRLWTELESGAIDARGRLREATDTALARGDWRLGREAVAALEDLESWEALEAALVFSAPRVQTAVIAALRRHGSDHHEAALIRALEQPEADGVVRWQAAVALGEAGRESVKPLLVRLRQDPSAAVRVAAVASLARIAGPEVAGALAERLREDGDAGVRVAAATALGEVGDEEVVADLRQAEEGLDLRGVSVSWAVDLAVRTIEGRGEAELEGEHETRSTPPIRFISAQALWSFRRGNLLAAMVQVVLGAVMVGLAKPWMAAGYLLYAGFAKGVIEPYMAPFDFFADKLCWIGRPNRAPRRGWLRSRLRPSLVYLPLRVLPTACWLLLLVAHFSWWLVVLPPVVDFFLTQGRHGSRTVQICPSCPAREDCHLWQRFARRWPLSRRLAGETP